MPRTVRAASRSLERQLEADGHRLIAGVDEVGRGPLAGPVVAAAVIMPAEPRIVGVNDSKLLSADQRESLAETIREVAVCWALGIVSAEEIDAINILRATHRAMASALGSLEPCADFALVDGLPVEGLSVPSQAVVKGDSKCYCIAAASILAKVHRDALMRELDATYPGYGFATNMGYGSPEHIKAIESLGPSPAHRRSFDPLRTMLAPRLDI